MAVIADNLGIYIPILGFPCCKESSFLSGSDVKEIGLPCRRHVFSPCVRKIPWRREWLPTPVCLPGKSHGWRSLAACRPWGREESDTTERLHFSPFTFMHWRRKWQPTSVFLPGESHGQRSLAGYSPRGDKQSDVIEQLTLHFKHPASSLCNS